MKRNTIIVLGASGMLGSMIANCLDCDEEVQSLVTVRSEYHIAYFRQRLEHSRVEMLDATHPQFDKLCKLFEHADWIINAIGIIKPYIRDDNALEVERALKINALFPHLLAKAAQKTGCHILQIATDCVYSGEKGGYVESDAHDALDAYGKTKSLGEVNSPFMHHLRCSIVGPEIKSYVSLLEWVIRQEKGARISGFTNHLWNGVTTYHFAKICLGVIKNKLSLPHIQHVVPKDALTKDDLLNCFARCYQRKDIVINPVLAATEVNRTLGTSNSEMNYRLWGAAGYDRPPSIAEMVAEMAKFSSSLWRYD
jgi:dTDP-4-dehydrorhamnose reductase